LRADASPLCYRQADNDVIRWRGPRTALKRTFAAGRKGSILLKNSVLEARAPEALARRTLIGA